MATSSEQEIETCTNTDIEECTINCQSTDCDGAVINAADKDSLTVVCQDDDSEGGCADLDIICPANGDCIVHCDMKSGCDRLNITHNAFSDDGYINKGEITLLCSADLSCRNIQVDAPNADHLLINATAYNSLTQSHIHAEDANVFVLHCDNEDEAYRYFRACSNVNLFLSDHADDSVEIYCHGNGCGKMDFYIDDVFSESDRIDLNIKAECDCEEWTQCMGDIGIYCDSYDVNTTEGEYVSYNTFVRVTDTNCSDASCGCDLFVDRIANNFDDSCPNITDSDTMELNVTTTETEIHFDVDTTTGTVMGVIMTLGAIFFLLFFCVNRKYHRQVRSTRFRAATGRAPPMEEVPEEEEEEEEEPSVSIIEDQARVPTKR